MILFLELTSSLLFIKFQCLLFDPVCSFVSDSFPLLFCCYIGLYLSDNVEGAFRILFSLYLDCVPKDTLFSFFGCCFRSFPEMLGCPWLHAHTEELMWKSQLEALGFCLELANCGLHWGEIWLTGGTGIFYISSENLTTPWAHHWSQSMDGFFVGIPVKAGEF